MEAIFLVCGAGGPQLKRNPLGALLMEPDLTDEQVAQYNRIYKQAFRRVRPNILIDGESQSGRPGWLARRRLRQGIAGFEAALAIAPFKWECRFWIGKALQRLGNHQESMTWFTEALRQEPDNPTIAKEAANAALELGQFQVGIGLLRPATALRPTDPTLHYDLAIHLLLSGRPNEAYASLQEAARLEGHRHTARLMDYVEKIMTGQTPCPSSVHELKQGA